MSLTTRPIRFSSATIHKPPSGPKALTIPMVVWPDDKEKGGGHGKEEETQEGLLAIKATPAARARTVLLDGEEADGTSGVTAGETAPRYARLPCNDCWEIAIHEVCREANARAFARRRAERP